MEALAGEGMPYQVGEDQGFGRKGKPLFSIHFSLLLNPARYSSKNG